MNQENWNQMTTKRKTTTKKTTKPRAKRSTVSTYDRTEREMASDAYWRGIKSQLTDPPPPMTFLAGALLLALCILSTAVIAYVAHDWWTQ